MRLYSIAVPPAGPPGEPDPAELIADRVWQAGAAGIWEVDGTLRVGVEDDRAGAFVAALADLGPTDVTDVEAVELSGQAVTAELAGRLVDLWVPPTVFGDGSHPTTAGCLAILDGLVHPGDRVLDVGCGSGILSISAATQGGEVTAIDIDPEAVQATADNAARNGLAVRAASTPLDDVEAHFDVVVANLTAGALAPLVPDLVRVTATGGRLLLSGMLDAQWSETRAAVASAAGGTDVVTESVDDGWRSVLLRLP